METNLKSFVIENVKLVMGLDISSFSDDIKFNQIPEWDSFNNLMLISKFQDMMNVNFTAIEIEETKTIGDLYRLIESKVNKDEQ